MRAEEIIAEIDRRVAEDDYLFNISDDFKYLPMTVAEYKRLREREVPHGE